MITKDTLTAKLREAEHCRENALQAASHWAGRAEQLRELLTLINPPPPPVPGATPPAKAPPRKRKGSLLQPSPDHATPTQ
jgi:hypothetical protein